VTLDPEVVRERLRLLDETAAELERHADATAEALGRDLARRWVLERGLIAGANLLFDVTDHVLAGHFGAHPETYEAALRELWARGVISDELYGELRGLGGLRNLLVHLYARIDPARIAEHAARAPRRFRRFAAEVIAWLDRSAGA
jgi:uncharacterized protein YutE (UPF0331/DUF86 family)